MGNLRLATFLPAIICMLITVAFTLVNKEFFISATAEMNNAIIDHLSWLFNLAAVSMVGAVIYAYISPIGKVVIGGKGAKRIYTPFKWFAVSLTSVIAMGILFWAVAEPIVHYYNPPAYTGIEAKTVQATQFAMSTIFVHWTITPYAIYTVASLVFALALHNLKMKFSIGSMFRPILGKYMDGTLADVIDG
ncbi:BCCT family transporter, partial [Vibrio cyclitrophicus]